MLIIAAAALAGLAVGIAYRDQIVFAWRVLRTEAADRLKKHRELDR